MPPRWPLRADDARPAGVWRTRRLVLIVCGALTMLCVTGRATEAHEAGTTRVVASFAHDWTYAIEVTTDAAALLARLEQARRLPRSSPSSAAALQEAFDVLCDEVPRHLSIVFDERPVIARAVCAVDPASPDADADPRMLGVTVTLRGEAPPQARTFRWTYDLAFATYGLTLQSEGPEAAGIHWLEGGETTDALEVRRLPAPPSRWARLRGDFSLGFGNVVPRGLDHLLFVLTIALFSRRTKPLLWQAGAFSVAHAVGLVLVWFRVIADSTPLGHTMAAVTIVGAATANLRTSGLEPWRILLMSASGFVHGLDLAGAFGGPAIRPADVSDLIGFSAGSAAATMTIVAAAAAIVGRSASRRDQVRRFIVVPGSVALALAGVASTAHHLGL